MSQIGKSLPQFNMSEYIINHYINFGRFGHLHYCTQKKDNKQYFIKILKKSVILDKKLYDKIYNEILIYIKLKQYNLLTPMISISINDPRYLGFMFEYLPGGKLKTLLKEQKVFTLENTKFYLANLILILDILHQNKIIYRDLNPNNILIKQNGYLTLLDFSYSKELKQDTDLTYTLCGTPNYMAPEIIINKGYSFSVDYWSLGVVLFEMLVGKDPFNSKDPILIYQNILTNKIKYPKVMDRDAKTLINHLLCPDPNERYGCTAEKSNKIKSHRLFIDFRWKKLQDMTMEAPFIPDIENEEKTLHFDKEKENQKLKEIYDKNKEESEKQKKEQSENKNPSKNSKKVNLIEGIEIIDSDTEAKEIHENDDPFINW